MGSKLKTKSARFQDKRELILGAAATAFNTHGVNGASLGDIASSVDLVTSGITYYYRKKEDLAAACFLRSIAQAKALVLEAANETTVARRVGRLFALHIDQLASIQQGRHQPLVGFSDMLALPEPLLSSVLVEYVDLFRRTRNLLKDGDGTNSLGRETRTARAHILISVLNSVRDWVGRCEVEEYPRLAQRVSDILLHGAFATAASWPTDAAWSTLDLPEPKKATDDTTEMFLQAATSLVNEHGYSGASIDRIMARLDATKGKFYHRNDAKLDLITACFERTFDLQRHVLRTAEQQVDIGAMRLCAVTRALVRFQISERGPLLRNSAFSALPDPAHRATVVQSLQRLVVRLAGMFVDGMIDRSLRPQDPNLSALILITSINAAAELPRWIGGISSDSATRIYVRPSLLGLLCDDA